MLAPAPRAARRLTPRLPSFGRGATEDQRRELKARYKAQERHQAQTAMTISEEQLTALLAHLDVSLAKEPCDDKLRLTERWATRNDIGAGPLKASLAVFGAFCDCEVLANVDPGETF